MSEGVYVQRRGMDKDFFFVSRYLDVRRDL